MTEDSPDSLLNLTFDNISSRPIVRPAVGYIRVSTGKQSDTGMSLDAQADAIRGEAARLSYDLNEIYEEAASAYGPDSSRRSGLLQALKRASELGAPLIVPSIDRLSRDLSVMDILEASRVQVISVREGKCGKKRLRALIRAAAEQSDEAATRAQEAAARSRAAGRGPGCWMSLRTDPALSSRFDPPVSMSVGS